MAHRCGVSLLSPSSPRHLPLMDLVMNWFTKKEASRKYIDLIRDASSKWANWDPPKTIRAGDIGFVNRDSGEFERLGNIYRSQDMAQLGCDAELFELVQSHPATVTPADEVYTIKSYNATQVGMNAGANAWILHSHQFRQTPRRVFGHAQPEYDSGTRRTLPQRNIRREAFREGQAAEDRDRGLHLRRIRAVPLEQEGRVCRNHARYRNFKHSGCLCGCRPGCNLEYKGRLREFPQGVQERRIHTAVPPQGPFASAQEAPWRWRRRR